MSDEKKRELIEKVNGIMDAYDQQTNKG